jgi:peptide/nickel transport system substrate-binding protein
MKKLKLISCILFIYAVLMVFPSCSKGQAINSNDLRFGFTTEPSTFDPLNPGNTADGRSILFNVFEGLVKPDSNGILQPALAESWTIEQDALVYNFTLRKGVRFHDGSTLNSADVKFSLDTAIALGFNGLGGIKEISTNTENQVKIILNSPDPEFLPYLTIGIVKAGNNNREKDVFGTGPFSVKSYTTQRDLVLKKFDNYWQNKAHLDTVTIVFFENFDAMITALRGGSIDGARLTGSMTSQLPVGEFDTISSYSAAVHLLALNNASAPLNDLRVRQALNYGIDVQNIIDSAFFGMGKPSGSPVIPGLTLYYQDSLEYPYNPERARSLLAEAGFDGQNRKLTLEITVPSSYAMHVDTAQVIVNQLEKIGALANIKLVDWNTWLSDVYSGRQYQSTIISLDSPNVSPKSFLSRYHSNAGNNFINFKNAAFDGIFDSVLIEKNDNERIRQYKEAQRVITENAASVYIQDIFYFFVLRGGLFSGVLNYPLYVIDFASISRY